MNNLNLILPIRIVPTENEGYIIVDSQDSEFFFCTDKKTKELKYDGCCVSVENKEIVFDHLKATPEELDVVLKNKSSKSLHNTTANGAKKNVKDIQFWGNGDTFELICKASSQEEGWMKSTKAMCAGNSVIVQVTTQQRNPDGSYSIAEALTTVDNAVICEYYNQQDEVVYRTIIPRDTMEEGISSKIVYLDPSEKNN
jgi:hypothetical protein